jgi:membrane associated rhomboid family serine protease
MWLFYWAEHLFRYPFHELGVLPRDPEGLKGILLMPLIHSPKEIEHIVNNSMPAFVLTATLFYFYRAIAMKVFIFIWVMTGVFLWIFAENKGAYHIGMSGVIYGLVAFLFTSGVLRKYLPLQAISLFVVFVYGSMIWGIFPMKQHVSWEGHLMGFLSGIFLAYYFRKEGPQRPKYQYEIEKEMGIEPPDLEGMWLERQRQAKLAEEDRERREKGHFIVYHYIPHTRKEDKPSDEK